MEALAYILVLTLALGTIFFAIAFREPPRIDTNKDK
jgi:photosystem II PsbT protein